MCLVCKDWQLGKLTNKEALRAIGEMVDSGENKEHLMRLAEKILDKEVPMGDDDGELNKSWHDETHKDK